jgi:hypothetical protein
MTLLANYKKNDVNNAYYRGLKALNNEDLFKTFAQVLTVQSNELIKYVKILLHTTFIIIVLI